MKKHFYFPLFTKPAHFLVRHYSVFAIWLASSLLSVHAQITISEDFDYGNTSGNLSGQAGGTGFAAAWTGGSGAYTATGLSFGALSGTGGAMVVTSGTNSARQITTGFAASGPVSGSFLFKMNAAPNSQSVLMLGLGTAGSSNNQNHYLGFMPANDGQSGLPALGIKGTSISAMTGGGALTVGTTYLYAFSYDNNSTSAWILTLAQYNNFYNGTTLDQTAMNAATIGSGATNVTGKVTLSTNPANLATMDYLYSYFFSNGSMTVDRIRMSGTAALGGLGSTTTTYTFNGTTNTDWATASNWSTGVVPTTALLASGDAVVIAANCTMNDVTITFPSGTSMTVNTGITLSPSLNTYITISSGATLTLNASASMSQGRITNAGTMDIYGTYSAFYMTNNSGGVMNVKSGGLYSCQACAQAFNSGGTVNNDGTLYFGTGGNAGTINNNASGLISDGAGGAQLTNSGTINNAGTFTSRSSSTTGSFVNTGILNMPTSCFFTVGSGGSFSNTGSLTVPSGSSFNINASGTLTNNSAGTITNNGAFAVNASGTMTNNGTYKGSGAYNTSLFTNPSGGIVAPGTSPGCQTYSNGFTNAGTLQIELGGTTACTQYDRLNVTGTATLGGTLDVSLINSYVGNNGDQLTIINATALSGTFATVNLPANWFINYNLPAAGQVTLSYNAPLVVAAALNFDGTNDVVTIPHNAAFNSTSLTAECWIKTTASPATAGIINKYVAASANGWQIYQVGGNLVAWVFTQPSSFACSVTSSGQAINDGNWHHIAFAVDASGGKIYIDGVLRGSAAWSGTIGTVNATTPISLGWYNGAAGTPSDVYFNGSMDEVRIWNYARTQSEIQATMNTEIALMPSCLLAYYKFNQGVANGSNTGITTLPDIANSTADNGTLSGFALTGNTSNWTTGSGITEVSSVYDLSAPEINLKGNGNNITYGSTTPATSNHTDFGIVASGGSFARTFTIENAGSSTLTINSITSSNAQFVVSNIPSSVASNSTATFTVTFTPTGYGLQSSTITVNNNDCDESAYAFTVQAMTPFTLGFDCANGTLGNYYNGGAGPNVGVSFNTGSASGGKLSTNPGPIINVPAGFTTAFALEANLCVGFGINIYSGLDGTGTLLATQGNNPGTASITFSGTAKSITLGLWSCGGTYDNLTFGSTTLGTPVVESTVEINVQGGSPLTSIPDGDTSPSTPDDTDFGNVTVNGSLARSFTIQNTGSTALTINSITSNNTKFVVSNVPTSVAANSSATFTVTFNPTAIGAQNATITVNNNDCDEAAYDFAVTGNGTLPGAALDFDGVNDNITTAGALIAGQSQVTFEAWVKPIVRSDGTTLSQFPSNVISTDISGSYGRGFGVNLTSSESGIGIEYHNGFRNISYAFTTNTWYHVAVVYTSTNIRTYVNGNLVDDFNVSNTATNGTVFIGKHNDDAGYGTRRFFKGSIDDVRIWNTARTCDQISQLRNCELTPANEPNLVAYYKFNQGVAAGTNTGITTLTDATSNANNGTLNGFALTGTTSNWITPGGVTTGTNCSAVVAPEINVQGNLQDIADGDTSPTTADFTDFGNVTVNGSLARSFTIQNTGNTTLTITNITSNNTKFVVSNVPTSVASNSSATFTVTFNPTATGAQNATITINNNDCDEAAYDFAVTGTGITLGAALTLDGSNDYVNLGTSAFEFVGSFTIETWVNATLGSTTNFNQGRIMDKGVATGEGPALDLYSGIRYISANGGSGQYVITAPTQVPANTWSHIALTIDVANLVGKIYYNGTLVKTQALSGDVAANPTYNLLLGATDGAGSLSNFFDGKLDEFRVWNRALCQNEIQAQMNCELAGSESGLMIYYNFNQGIASGDNNGLNTVNDVATGSGHGGTNNGTLTNFALSGSSSNWTTPGGVTTGTSCPAVTFPEINLKGNGNDINYGSTTPAISNHTDFGNVLINGSFARTFTIDNSAGTADLTISSITKSGTNQSEFVVSGITLPMTITTGTTTTFTVTFTPTASGTRTATLIVNNNDCDEAVYDFAVTGNGALPGAALDFDGINDDVMIPHASNITFDLNQDFTVSLHVKIPSSNQPNTVNIDNDIVEKVGSGGGYPYVIRYYNHTAGAGNNGKIIAARWNGSTAAIVTSTVTLNDDTWHHIAFVKSGPTLYLYVDGVLNSTTPDLTTGSTANTAPLYLGSRLGQMNWFKGGIDNLRIWNVARSCEEIRQLRNCELTGSEPNLVAYYKFNQGLAASDNSTVTSLTDATANGNNGTFNHFALNGSTSNFITPGGVTSGTSCSAVVAPEINLQGGSPLTDIADGSTTTSTTNDTDFGSVLVNGSVTKTFTISNATGTGDLVISSITKSGTNQSEFVVSGITLPMTITAGTTTTFTVTFTPTASGTRTATLIVNNNDCDEAAYDFAVTGNGALPGAALNFDGTDDYISVPDADALDLGASLTLEAWVKPTSFSTYNIIVDKRMNTDVLANYGLTLTGGKPMFYFWANSSNPNFHIAPSAISLNAWSHIAVTYDGAMVRIFVNGTQVYSQAETAIPPITDQAMNIGRNPATLQYFNGDIDEVRIWNTARSCAQIAQQYNCELVGNESGLVAYYKFNQGIAEGNNSGITNLTDSGPNGFNGTFNNMPRTASTSNFIAIGGVTTGTSCPAVLAPEINVQGNSMSIADGDATPGPDDDHTNFGSVIVGNNVVRTFTIENTGTAALTISGITSSNTKFTIGNAPASIPAMSSATFTVTFVPTAPGTQNATITINNNDCNEAVYDFAITGSSTSNSNALHFDGADDYVPVPFNTSLMGSTPTTIEFWAKAPLQGIGFPVCINTADVAVRFHSGTHLQLEHYGGPSFDMGEVNDGCWHHYAFTWDGTTVYGYVDGQPTPNPSQVLLFPATSVGTLFIGVYNLQYFWNGAMDELRIWNVQRTQSQLQANLYNELAGNEAGLVAYYNFNEGIPGGNNASVTTLYDNQTNTPAHNGTLTGFALTGTASNWITSGALIHYPEIDVQGNSVSIVDGDNTPSASDHTTFGDILVGTNLARTYTIKNTGSEVLNVSSIGSSNPLFTVGTLTPASPIPVGQSATFTVTFAPLAVGTETATITINNDDCNEAVYDFAVTGNGANVGAALKFDGVDDYVDLGTSFGNFGTNDFTLETWFKTTQNSSNYVGLLSKRSPCNHDNFWNIVMVNGKIHFEIDENGANYLDLITPLAYNDGTWHHVACVRSGTSLKIYMDGSLVTSGNTSGTTNLTNATSVKMGQSPCGNFIGDLDEVRIWNAARTCEEIKQSYNCELAGNEPNLTAYYKFNQGLAVSDNSGIPNLTDSSPNSYNGTFQNMPRTGSISNFITPGGVTTGTSCSAVVAPEINVKGNMVSIPDGNTTTSPTDHTDFGNVTVNTTLVRTFTIENTGNNPLTITNISSNNPLFTVGSLSPASPIVANGTATFTVTFTPTATGVQNATITISNNDCDEAMYDFAVKATGECDATASIANTNNPICSGNNAVFNLSGTSGAIVTYNLNGAPNTTATLTGGMATVTVTGATANQTLNLVSVNNGTCSINVTGNATVTVKPLPMVSTPLSSVCVGSTITLSPTSGGTWSSSDDTKATVTSAGVVTGIASGSVTFTFTETASGCSNTTSSVTVNPKPTSVVSGGGIVCAGETLPNVSIELTGTGPWNLTYSNGTSSTPVTGINSSPYVITGAGAGNYTVTALGDANCTGTSMTGSASVVVNPQPTLTAGTITNPSTCGGTNGSIAFTSTNLPNGTYSLSYSGAGSPKMVTVSNNTFTLSGLSAGNYSNFSITNLGCTGTFATTQSLNDPAAPTLTAGTITNPSTCGGTNGSIAFTSTNLPNGTYTLSYSGAGSPKMVTVSNNTFTLSGLSAGNYSNFSITNLGCTGTFATTQSLNDPAAPTLTAGTITNPSTCGGTNGSIAFTSTNLPNGTYTLSYSGAGSPKMVTVSNNTFTLSGLSAGNYSNFSITNLGCTGTFATTQSLSDPAAPTLTAGTITNPSTCGGTNGSIAFTSTNLPNGTYTLSYSGTGSPKMITVSNNAFTLSGLSAGNYSNFSITNLGCTGTFATTQSLNDPAAPTLAAGTITNPSTCGGTNGSIAFTSTNLPNGTYTLSYSGTGSPKMITVSNNAFTLSGLSAGNYSNFSITNLGCTGTLAEVQILNNPPLPQATIIGTTEICQNTPFPTITFTGSNGTEPYTFTYKINGGANLTVTTTSGNSVSLNQTTAAAGTFVYSLLSVKDAKGCEQAQSASATITVNPLPLLSFTGPNPVCQGSNSALSANLPGAWTANDPSKATIAPDGTINALTPGTATFTFTVAGTGCQATTAPLTIKPTPTSALTASKYDVCPNTPVTLNPNCSIPTSSVNWNPGGPTVTPDAATIPYIYKARCVADGCVGNESSIEVRTHRILVDMKDLDVGVLPLPIVRSVIDNMAPTNQVNAPVFPRRWTFIANGCEASESAVFKLSGPVNFSAIDNAGTYALFANDGLNGSLFYSIDHPNYGNGGSFPNGTYTLTIDLRSQDGVGGPFPKNRVAVGSLLATRTLQFTVVGPSHGNTTSAIGSRQSAVGSEQWVVGSGQFAEVAPNPVSNIMRLKVTDAKGQKVNVSLLDVSGRTMLKRDFVPETNQHQEEFEVSEITNGMYFLRVNTADKNATLKVVKVE